jgi:hypothetical protein
MLAARPQKITFGEMRDMACAASSFIAPTTIAAIPSPSAQTAGPMISGCRISSRALSVLLAASEGAEVSPALWTVVALDHILIGFVSAFGPS